MEQTQGPLPMLLWQDGLINLNELDKIYDWLDSPINITNQES